MQEGRTVDLDSPHILESRKVKLGPDHIDTLDAMQKLAVAFCSGEQYDASERLFEQVLEKLRTNFGPIALGNLRLGFLGRLAVEAERSLKSFLRESNLRLVS
jgi:hypothetical protein